MNKLPLAEDEPQYLPPDELDYFLASHVLGLPCPFCGAKGMFPKARLNKVTNLYGYLIWCTDSSLKCLAEINSGGHYTRDEARDEAMKRWNTRNGTVLQTITSERLRQSIKKEFK